MINDIDINKIVVPNKIPLAKQEFKYFIGYKDAKKVRPLWIFCSKISIYRDFYKTKRMYFFRKE